MDFGWGNKPTLATQANEALIFKPDNSLVMHGHRLSGV